MSTAVRPYIPSTDDVLVNPADKNGNNRISKALVSAFRNDPVMSMVLPGKSYEELAPRLYRWTTWAHQPNGLTRVVEHEGEIKAVAIWQNAHDSISEQLRTVGILGWMLWHKGISATYRVAKAFYAAETKRHKLAPGAMYLAVLGVDAAFQGHGAGTRLLRPTLEQFDREGKTAYLESSNPRNVPFYERLGFEVVEKEYPFEHFPEAGATRGPLLTLMIRHPRPQQTEQTATDN